MGTVDVYRVTTELDDPTLEVMVTRLEARGKHPRFAAMMDQYLEAMDIDAASSVLDLGCGTGVASRGIARRKGFTGRVTGIDLSPFLIAAAKRLSEEDGVANRVELRVGDSHGLQLGDATFDAAVAHTLISHVENPLAVLREMARVVKPGGMLGIFDGDYASITYAMDDPEKGRIHDEAIIKTLVTNPRVMRQMPQLLREAGLELAASFAHVVADIGRADFYAGAIQSLLRLLPRSGAMSALEAQSWVETMQRRSEQGIFFAATNYFAYVARRP